ISRPSMVEPETATRNFLRSGVFLLPMEILHNLVVFPMMAADNGVSQGAEVVWRRGQHGQVSGGIAEA
ncbi:hypothetical protein E9U92_RS27905, partial [Escherichia coli]|nr:hypothetical protein [Escherichia coli]